MTKAAYASVLAAVLLAACGGGGGSGASTSAPTTNTAEKRATAGDVYTYARRDTTVGGVAASYLFSRQYQLVNDDGSTIDVETFSNAFSSTVTSVSAKGGVTAWTLKNDPTVKCTYAPENLGVSPPYQVGKAWDNSWTKTCGSTVSSGRNRGSIVSQEAVTVPAGTFTAFKEVYVVTEQQTTPASEQVTTTNVTCWRDVDLKQYLKCEFAMSYSVPGAVAADAIAGTTYELDSFIVATSAKSIVSPARFAGTWSSRYYGGAIGMCAGLTISATGAIAGSCEAQFGETFAVSGTVDAQGNVSFGANPAGTRPAFTGRFRLISEIDGTWNAGPGNAGGWAMYHH
ncbi:MAG TPA: hypothetical protein VGE12_03035 [Noviherbaspirillum sp.]